MKKLYEIAQEFKQVEEFLESILNSETSKDEEVFNVLSEKLNEIELDFETKVENIFYILKDLQSEDDVLTNEIKRLTERRRVVLNEAIWLKEYLKKSMIQVGRNSLKTPLMSVHLRNKPDDLKILNELEIPSEFFEHKITLKKDELKRYVKANPDCGYAVMEAVEGKSIVVK